MKKVKKQKNAITLALIDLLHKKPLDLITIKDLCLTAQVGGTAFYNHFKNKEDVLKSIYKKAHEEIFGNKFMNIDYLYSDEFIKDMIYFFDVHSDLLFILFKWNLTDLISKYNTEMSLEYIKCCDDEIIKPMLTILYFILRHLFLKCVRYGF